MVIGRSLAVISLACDVLVIAYGACGACSNQLGCNTLMMDSNHMPVCERHPLPVSEKHIF